MPRRIGVLVGSVLTAVAACGSALAANNPLGFYVGAGIGSGNPSQYAGQSDKFVWDALVGIRPSPYLGGELQYLDFGNTNPDSAFHSDDHSRAMAAFAVGYLPLPWIDGPFDLFGKVGVAQLWAPYLDYFAPPPGPIGNQYHSESQADFAYGGGAQVHLGAFAVRLEYEAVDATFGNPWLSTVEVTWSP
jgi:Outer membrane protein beta-barrel domain